MGITNNTAAGEPHVRPERGRSVWRNDQTGRQIGSAVARYVPCTSPSVANFASNGITFITCALLLLLCGDTANPFSPPSKLDSGIATAFMQPPPMLLSPYSEDNPLDSDALYNALCALRNSKSQSEGGSEPVSGGVGPSCGLFSSVEEEGGVVDSDLETLGTRGLGRLLDMLPL